MEYEKAPSSTTEENAGAPAKARRRFFTAKNIAYFGILAALEVVLLLWGSAVPTGIGGATLNFSLVPIVLGAILMGPLAGAFLGLIAGAAILIMVVLGAQGPVFLFLFNEQPVVIALVCLLKTAGAGLVSGLLYRALAGHRKAAVFAASAAAPVVNTGLFILGLLCMSGAVREASVQYGLGYDSAIAVIILVFVTYNFFIEFAINLVLAPALNAVIRIAEKQFVGKKRKV